MSETTSSSSPASAPPPAAEPKTHHAALQPRDQGKFAGPPATPPSEAAPPPGQKKKWKVGDKEFDNSDDLASFAAERHSAAAQREVDRKALEKYYREAREAQQRLAALQKDKRQAFQTPEEARAFAVSLIHEEIQEAALTPEQRQMRRLQREAEEYKAKLAEREEQERAAAEEQRTTQVRQKLAADVSAAMNAAGLPRTPGHFRRVVAVMRANLQAGLPYPPEVVARQVSQSWREETQTSLKGLSLEKRLELLPDLIDQLEAAEDPALLKRFVKLGERLRRLNLEGLGVASHGAPPAPAAPAGRSGTAPRHSKPEAEWTPADWEDEFKARARG